MSEATEAVAAEVADYARHGSWKTLEARLAARVAAAEERGRRRGVEERDELRAMLSAVRPLVREEFLGAGAMTERGWESLLARIDAALAPRDSAPQRDPYVDAGVDEWSGAPRDDMTKAPRDSGKEPVRDNDDDLRALGERWTGKDRK